MKVLGYVMLHYGIDYLDACLYSLKQFCNDIIILYTDRPSHNQGTNKPRPDEGWQLKAISDKYGCQWIDVTGITGEGYHREKIFNYASGYDLIVNADSDEVWDYRQAPAFLQTAANTDARYIGINGFIHFWRNFDHYCEDGYRPIRIHNMHSADMKARPEVMARIYHFGYAVPFRTMKYKLSIHGHRDEIRAAWLTDIWMRWNGELEGKFHPVSFDNISRVWFGINKFNKQEMPDILKQHPYFNNPMIQ